MQGRTVQGQEDQGTGEACAFVAVAKSLRTGVANQIHGSQVGEIGAAIVGPPVSGASERGEHDLLIQDTVHSTVPFDLLRMDCEERWFSEPAWLDGECPLAHLASARKTLSYSAMIRA